MSVPPKTAEPGRRTHELPRTARPQAPLPSRVSEQADWVRSLARNLVRDPSGAEDIAQEALLAALARPPQDVGDSRRLRAWLGRVTHNLSNLSTRRNLRRRSREERVAREERLASTADRVAERALAATLQEAVAALPEPFRGAIRARYFEGATIGEIARRTGTTENAVRKRLWRARKRLRESLEGMHNGEPTAWFSGLGLLTLGRRPASGGPGLLGASGSGLRAAAAAAVLAGSLGTLFVGPAGRAPAGEGHAELGVLLPPASPEGRRVAQEDPRPREHEPRSWDAGLFVIDPPRGTATPPVGPPASAGRPGRVVDLDGRGLEGLGLFVEGEPGVILATTDAQGRFRVPAGTATDSLRVAGEGHALLGSSRGPTETTWVAAPTARAAGLVVGGLGEPLECGLELRLEDRAFARLDVPLHLEPRLALGAADGSGIFDVRLPAGDGLKLAFVEEGFELAVFDSLDVSAGMLVRLRPLGRAESQAITARAFRGGYSDRRGTPQEADPDGRLFGRLVDASGEPLAEWRMDAVPTGDAAERAALSTETADDGSFEFRGKLGAAFYLVAHDPEHPDYLRAGPFLAGDSAIQLRFASTVLGSPPTTGRLLGPDGGPLAGAELLVSATVEQNVTVPTGWRFVTDSEGNYTLPPLPGTANVEVDDPRSGRVRLSLEDGAITRVEGPVYLALENVPADAVRLLDGEGLPLVLHGPVTRSTRFALADGRTPLLQVGGEVRTLVLEVDGAEVRRDIRLEPGSTNRLRW